MAFLYKTRGTCSRNIILEMDGDIIKDVEFIGGCDGNLKAIAKLVAGMPVGVDALGDQAFGHLGLAGGDLLVHGPLLFGGERHTHHGCKHLALRRM